MKIKNDPSGIDFKSLSNSNVAWNIPVKSDGTYRLGSSKNDLEYADEDGVQPIFNAVEIDWNSAELDLSDSSIAADVPGVVNGKKVINTTGELFADIDESFPFIRFGAA